MSDDQAADPHDLAGSVAPGSPMDDRREPEQREPIRRPDVDMGWLTSGPVLVRPEKESVWPEAMNGGHADLGNGSAGEQCPPIDFTAAYRGQTLVEPRVSDA